MYFSKNEQIFHFCCLLFPLPFPFSFYIHNLISSFLAFIISFLLSIKSFPLFLSLLFFPFSRFLPTSFPFPFPSLPPLSILFLFLLLPYSPSFPLLHFSLSYPFRKESTFIFKLLANFCFNHLPRFPYGCINVSFERTKISQKSTMV